MDDQVVEVPTYLAQRLNTLAAFVDGQSTKAVHHAYNQSPWLSVVMNVVIATLSFQIYVA
jgi:hypothetical protein